jgi:hypothetical protein
MDLRDCTPFPSQKRRFEVAYSEVAIATQRNPDKELLWATILQLREQGKSYREIAQVVSLHWTRIQQIVKWVGESSEMLG